MRFDITDREEAKIIYDIIAEKLRHIVRGAIKPNRAGQRVREVRVIHGPRKPHVNSIYQKIGYNTIYDSVMLIYNK